MKKKDSNDYTALMWAVESRRTEAVEKLISAGADIDAQDIHANTALMLIAQMKPIFDNAIYKIYNIVEKLISAGADIDAQDIHGNTALMLTVLSPYANGIEHLNMRNIAEELLSVGANTEIQNKDGDTALILETKHAWKYILHNLLSARAEKYRHIKKLHTLKNKNWLAFFFFISFIIWSFCTSNLIFFSFLAGLGCFEKLNKIRDINKEIREINEELKRRRNR